MRVPHSTTLPETLNGRSRPRARLAQNIHLDHPPAPPEWTRRSACRRLVEAEDSALRASRTRTVRQTGPSLRQFRTAAVAFCRREIFVPQVEKKVDSHRSVLLPLERMFESPAEEAARIPAVSACEILSFPIWNGRCGEGASCRRQRDVPVGISANSTRKTAASSSARRSSAKVTDRRSERWATSSVCPPCSAYQLEHSADAPPGRTCGSGCENGDLWGAASTAGVAPLAAIVTSGFVMTV